MEDIVVFLSLKVCNFDNFQVFSYFKNAQITFLKKSQLKIISFLEIETLYIIHTWPEKASNGTLVNRVLQTLHGGSLKITLTVPLNEKRHFWYESFIKQFFSFFFVTNLFSWPTMTASYFIWSLLCCNKKKLRLRSAQLGI